MVQKSKVGRAILNMRVCSFALKVQSTLQKVYRGAAQQQQQLLRPGHEGVVELKL